MAENFYGLTDTGRERKNNEDAFIAQQDSQERYVIACVIDGVGGYSGGEIAAALARETVLQRLQQLGGHIIQAVTDAFSLANDKIWEEKQRVKEHSSMACVATLAVVDIEANQFYYAHVGDTRLYLLRDGSLVKVSRDQSFVGFLEDSGRLTEREAMAHPKRNEIDKALGFKGIDGNDADYYETGQSPFLPGDMVLLCSDGLTDLVDKQTITDILGAGVSLKSKCTMLIDAANERGGKDNITVVLVENNKGSKQYTPTRPMENTRIIEREAEEEARPVMNAAHPVAEKKKPSPKSFKGLSIFLMLLSFVLLGVCAYQYLNNKPVGSQVPAVAATPSAAPKPLTAQEIKLQAAITNCKGKLLLLADTAYRSPVIISKTIQITQDSLHIKAKGNITFQCDSGFSGPAFSLAMGSKQIVIDSVSFNNCSIAVAAFNNALLLKNVRFMNCKYPVQRSIAFPANKYVNGSLPAPLFTTDSLPQPQPKALTTHGAK